jgi:hypothetical protein
VDYPRDLLADWTLPASVRVLPCKAVVFTRRADDALRVLIHQCAIMLFEGVLLLCLYVPAAHFDGVELVAPMRRSRTSRIPVSGSKAHLLSSCLTTGIGHWPREVAHRNDDRRARRVVLEMTLLTSLRRETGGVEAVADRVG